MSVEETRTQSWSDDVAGAASYAIDKADIASLSQWQLIWRRFKRNRMAVIGSAILILFYSVALIGHFLSPYGLQTRFTTYIYAPPTRPRFVDANGRFHLRPFVYRLERNIDPDTLEYTYVPDDSVAYPIGTSLVSLKCPSSCSAPIVKGAICLRGASWALRFRSPSAWWASFWESRLALSSV
jgi:hypothetical protein